jgi:amino acid adenylation domain-containing protein/non-ribosomal peptide synthase protein (TIGR01720 family)/FkbM family methyltransferase
MCLARLAGDGEGCGHSFMSGGTENAADRAMAGFRLSPQQRRLWSLPGEAAAGRALAAVRVEGALDDEGLRAAVRLVIERHEILRTTFARSPGLRAPVQVVSEPGEPEWRLIHAELDEHSSLVDQFFKEERRRPPRGAGQPLLALSLVQSGPAQSTLLVSLPAMCADAHGLTQMVREIFRTYSGAVGEKEATDGEVVQYARFAEWQNQLAEEGDVDGARHWRDARLPVEALALPLPFERVLPAEFFAPESFTVPLPRELVAQIRALGDRCGTTFETILLACWLALLSRLTGRRDPVVGVACDGRVLDPLRGALGLFERYLPVHGPTPEGDSLASGLARVDHSWGEAREWQEYFSWEAFAPAYPEGRIPYFSLAFGVQSLPTRERCGGITFSVERLQVHTDRYKVRLAPVIRGADVGAEWSYDAANIAREGVATMARDWLRAVEAIVRHPEMTVAQLLRQSTAEEGRPTEIDCTGVERARDVSLHQLFEAQVASDPARIAVVGDGESVTYGELNARANQLARHLQSVGVGPETTVGVCLRRSANAVMALVAVLKAGGAFIPIDPDWPAIRRERILDDAGAAALVTTSEILGLTRRRAETLVCLDASDASLIERSAENLVCQVGSDSLAYVIYTSGSSGAPKGVMVGHRSIVNYVRWSEFTYSGGASQDAPLHSSLAFDLTLTSIFGPLATGGQITLVSEDEGVPALAAALERNRFTFVKLTPSHLEALSSALSSGGPALRTPVLIVGGEALTGHRLEQWRRRTPSGKVINEYGPTEATVGCCAYELTAESPVLASVPIGRPIANTQVHVLDEGQTPVAVGVAGEIYVGGVGLARGYLGRPDATAENFIPDPFSTRPGARLYRTGDAARLRADGSLEFLGRLDEMVKVRGCRVEPAEVEAVMREHPEVQDAIVVGRKQGTGSARLIAYVTGNLAPESGAPSPHEHRLPNGLEIAHLNRNETDLLYREIFMDRIYLKHGIRLRDGDCVFDVGANIGLFTLFVKDRCPNASVYAFEPLPPIFAALRANVSRFGLDADLFDCALSNRSGAVVASYYPGMSGMSGLYPDPVADEAVSRAFLANQGRSLALHASEILDGRFRSETFQCRARTLSEVIEGANVERIDLLKIDVEKSEWNVLEGIDPAHWSRIRQIVIEVHDLEGRLERVRRRLLTEGYAVVIEQAELLKGTGLHHVYARRLSAELPMPPGDGEEQSGILLRARRRQSSIDDLRAFLCDRLPEAMVPSAFVVLPALPVTRGGKLDRNALPEPETLNERHQEKVFVGPRTPAERVLAGLWGKALGLPKVGIHQNFFALGGDSIVGLQVVARARQAGLGLTPRHLFQFQTIAELAAVADQRPAPAAVDGPIEGRVPLTPVQRWLLERDLTNPHHFNQAVLFDVRSDVSGSVLAEALRTLVRHHDALRLRFARHDVAWTQWNAVAEEHEVLTCIDLSSLAEDERVAALTAAAAAQQTRLSITDGPLLRAAAFYLGSGRIDRLLLVVHHLAVDGVSWRILLEDLDSAVRQLREGQPVVLPPRTTPFGVWAMRLESYAGSETLVEEARQWLEDQPPPASRLPTDGSDGPNTEGSARVVRVSLGADETRTLLKQTPVVFGTQMNDVLLTALVVAFARWTGERALLVDLESHGREPIFEDIDLSRTVGCFTGIFPMRLEIEGDLGDPVAALKGVKEQLRRVPGRGLGYGVARYLSGRAEIVEKLDACPRAEVSFNYLGQFDQVLEGSSFGIAVEPTGPDHDPQGLRSHLLEISGSVAEGRLRMDWTYSEGIHRRETVELLAEGYVSALRSLISRCVQPESISASGLPYDPADRLSLGRATGYGPQVDEAYPLSPTQQGILFHALLSPVRSAYVVSLSFAIQGEIVTADFKRAWQLALDRHPVLRSDFAWEALAEPRQRVHTQVKVPWRELDCSDRPILEREAHLESTRQEDLNAGFDLGRAPVLRLALVRMGDRSWQLLWTFHHLLLDGWSVAIVIRDVLASYEGLRVGRMPNRERPRRYSEYIRWLRARDPSADETYWRHALPASRNTKPLGSRPHPASAAPDAPRFQERRLPAGATTALYALARRLRLTLNTVVLGAWALALRLGSGADDLVLGVTLAGRPASLAGSDEMVGLFINTLPLWIEFPKAQTLSAWLEGLQARQSELRAHEHSSLTDVVRWCGGGSDRQLFESLFVFENYPVDLVQDESDHGLRIVSVHSSDPSHYALTVTAAGGPELGLGISYDPTRIDPRLAARLMNLFTSALGLVVEAPGKSVGDISQALLAEDRQRGEGQRDSGRRAFATVKRRPVNVSSSDLVRVGTLPFAGPLPALMQPAQEDVTLAAWAESNRPLIEGTLRTKGAILFRGFHVASATEFERVVTALAGEPLEYRERSSPRRRVQGRIYTSTEHPADQPIPLHHENSYAHTWPLEILFCCVQPATSGGETPIADGRRVHDRIAPEIRQRFGDKGVLYVRSFRRGLGLPWQEVFQTDDRAAAETACRSAGYEVEWRGEERLRIRRRGPAVVRHPHTGEPLWFNHALFFHASLLAPQVRAVLLAEYGEEDLPNQTYYGDGSPIETSVIDHLREAYREETVSFPWQKGDLLMLDNMLIAHGRAAFEGSRTVLVAMAKAFEASLPA